MARDGAKWYQDEDEYSQDEGQILRRERSARDRCKKRKASTIRSGIDHYYTAKQNHGDFTDNDYDFDDLDDQTYH